MIEQRKISIYTSETIDAVIAGLDLKPTDKVWAVGKNGDVAIAISEFSNTVIVNEPREEQRTIIADKLRYVRNDNYKSFESLSDVIRRAKLHRPHLAQELNTEGSKNALKRRQEYFTYDTFKAIRVKYLTDETCLQVVEKPTGRQNESYNKMYVSHMIQDHNDLNTVMGEIDGKSMKLAIGGLMYVSNHGVIADPKRYFMLPQEVQKIKEQGALKAYFFAESMINKILPRHMKFEPELTQKAWDAILPGDISSPAVYRRVL